MWFRMPITSIAGFQILINYVQRFRNHGGFMGITKVAQLAKDAAIQLAAVKSGIKNKALSDIAQSLEKRGAEIVAANQADLKRAESESLAAPLLKRLKFNEAKIKEACEGLQSLIRAVAVSASSLATVPSASAANRPKPLP